MGDYSTARREYEKALVFNPKNVFINTRQIDIEVLSGNYTTSKQQYNILLSNCTNWRDTLLVFRSQQWVHKILGQIHQSFRFFNDAFQLEFRHSSSSFLLLRRVHEFVEYVHSDSAFYYLEVLAHDLNPHQSQWLAVEKLKIALELDDQPQIEKGIDGISATNYFYKKAPFPLA